MVPAIIQLILNLNNLHGGQKSYIAIPLAVYHR